MDTLLVEEPVTQVVTPVDQPSTTPPRRWTLWIAILGALVLISGVVAVVLAANDSPSPTVVPMSLEEAADRAFEDYVTDEGLTRYGDVETLRETAHLTCEAFDQGVDWASALNLMLNAGFSARDAGALIGASVAAYCPQHADVSP